MTRADAEFTLYSREGCHLCETMLSELTQLLQHFNHRCRVVNVNDDPELEHRYGARIPVLTAGDTEICETHFDRQRVTQYLSGRT